MEASLGRFRLRSWICEWDCSAAVDHAALHCLFMFVRLYIGHVCLGPKTAGECRNAHASPSCLCLCLILALPCFLVSLSHRFIYFLILISYSIFQLRLPFDSFHSCLISAFLLCILEWVSDWVQVAAKCHCSSLAASLCCVLYHERLQSSAAATVTLFLPLFCNIKLSIFSILDCPFPYTLRPFDIVKL